MRVHNYAGSALLCQQTRTLSRGAPRGASGRLGGPNARLVGRWETEELIPPDFPAYKPYRPFTVGRRDTGRRTGPDRSTAEGFMKKSGTRGAKVVVVVYDDPLPWEAGKHVVTMLHELGYHASRHVLQYADFPGDHYNAGPFARGRQRTHPVIPLYGPLIAQMSVIS